MKNSRLEKVAAIAQTLLLHNYNLVIFNERDYEIRDIRTGEVYWDYKNSNVSIEEFDVDSFLEICGIIIN